MNMFKKNEGFTLVELIVVIAILAILAAVAVPAYAGYISKANEASDYTQLDSMKTAIVFEAMEESPSAVVTGATITFAAGNGTGLDEISVTGTNLGTSGTATSTTVDITELYGAGSYTAKSGAIGATLTTDATTGTAKWTLTPAASN